MNNSKAIDVPIEKGCILSIGYCPRIDEENDCMSKVPYANAFDSDVLGQI